MALEAKQVETLTPIRLRYTGPVLDMTTAYDDQDLTHTEPVEFNKQYISTTVGRAILNDALPEGMPLRQRPAEEEGHRPAGQLLLPEPRPRSHGQDARPKSRTSASTMPPAAGLSVGLDDMVIPDEQVHRWSRRRKAGHRRAAAVPGRRHHQRRALQQGHPDLVGGHRARRRRDVQQHEETPTRKEP